MKKSIVLGMAVLAAAAFVSCKPSESQYKKAYEKAKQQELANQQQYTTQETTYVNTTTDNNYDNTNYNNYNNYNNNNNQNTYNQQDSNYSTSSVKRYCVVVGSFENASGAEQRRQDVINRGYGSAKIVYGDGRYRVVATSFSDLQSAKNSRNTLVKMYDGAWILDTQK